MATNVLFTELQANTVALRDEMDHIYCTISDKSDAVKGELYELKCRLSYNEDRIQELFDLLGPVLDAMTEKPKQKWLWEIFEPNDIEIDFPYNL